jgi:hypothetical protein
MIRALQPVVNDGFEHRPAWTGTPSFAVHDAHTPPETSRCLANEIA